MDPEEIARRMVADLGRDEALRQLRASSFPEDRAVLAAIESQKFDGPGFMNRLRGFYEATNPLARPTAEIAAETIESPRKVGTDVLRQIGPGLGEVLPTAALGFAEAQRTINPLARFIPNRAEELRNLLAKRRQETAPQSRLGAVARIGARIAGEGALAATPGGAASRALGIGRFAGGWKQEANHRQAAERVIFPSPGALEVSSWGLQGMTSVPAHWKPIGRAGFSFFFVKEHS